MIDEATKRRAACEACHLLNWAVGDLVVPKKLFQMSRDWEAVKPSPGQAIRATRRLLVQSIVISIYRLKETRQELIVGWLFSEDELEALGFPPIQVFFGGQEKWKSFLTLRGYAGHSYVKKATKARPGRIIDPKKFGKALRETGLIEPKTFLNRITTELLPGVENVRNELRKRYPEAEQFLKKYTSEIGEA